jgi:hypothetical protein
MPNGTYIKSDFRAHLELLKPDGFTLNSDDEFEKTISNGKIFIVCRGNEYFPHSFRFGSVLAKIRFANVEDKFAQACTATSNATYSADADDPTFARGFGRAVIGEANFRSLFDNEVEDDLSFQKVRHLLQQMIDAAIAWAAQNDTLQKAYDNAEALTFDERCKIVSYPFPSKYLIIKKILNKSDFQDFYAENIDFFTNEYSDPDEVTFLTALKAILDAL